MILWLIVGVMTAAALALVLVPLVRRRRGAASRAAYDLAVYRDQLKELESDQGRGLIGETEAVAARAEIERRMLATAQGPEQRGADSVPSAAPGPRASRWLGAAALAVGVPAAGLALYLSLGSPGLPSRPFADNAAPESGAATAGMQDFDTMVAKLSRRLEANPDDVQGWTLLGRTLIALERYDQAVVALRRAAALAGEDAAIMSALGEAMVFAAQGMVTPAARRAFEAVLEQMPRNHAARYYLGLARAQAGELRAALDIWGPLAAEAPAEAPWRAELVQLITDAAEELGVDIAAVLPAESGATASGATASGETALGATAEQEATIGAMVERLAARLEETPDDLEGWLRLGRSYNVLGDPARSTAAYARAAELAPEDPAVLLDHARAVMAEAQAVQGAALPAEAIAQYRRVLALDPAQPEALWFVGSAEAAAGNGAVARELWQTLLTLLPPDSPARAVVEQALAGL